MPSDVTPMDSASKFMVQPIDFDLDIGVVNDIDFDNGFYLGEDARALSSPLTSQRPSEIGEIRISEPKPVGFEARLTPPSPNHAFDQTFELDASCFLSLQGTSHGQALFLGRNKKIELPREWSNPDFPFVRSLPDGDILVSDTSFELALGKNTWILNRAGDVKSHFAIGSAAVEIVCVEAEPGSILIAVAYHPLSAKRFGHRIEPQQRTAIAFYDRTGRMVSTFNHEASRAGISADNVRTMTRISPSEILFVPESAQVDGEKILSPAIIYNARNQETTVFPMPYKSPESVSLALTADGTQCFLLASPEGYEDQVIAFDPVHKMSHYLGAFVGIFRGLALGDRGSQPFWGGFLAQEFSSGYDWVLPEPGVLESALSESKLKEARNRSTDQEPPQAT